MIACKCGLDATASHFCFRGTYSILAPAVKPKAIFKSNVDQGGCWFLLNWENRDGLSLLAPTLGSLIDRARAEEAAKG